MVKYKLNIVHFCLERLYTSRKCSWLDISKLSIILSFFVQERGRLSSSLTTSAAKTSKLQIITIAWNPSVNSRSLFLSVHRLFCFVEVWARTSARFWRRIKNRTFWTFLTVFTKLRNYLKRNRRNLVGGGVVVVVLVVITSSNDNTCRASQLCVCN